MTPRISRRRGLPRPRMPGALVRPQSQAQGGQNRLVDPTDGASPDWPASFLCTEEAESIEITEISFLGLTARASGLSRRYAACRQRDRTAQPVRRRRRKESFYGKKIDCAVGQIRPAVDFHPGWVGHRPVATWQPVGLTITQRFSIISMS